ncbi:putative tRNA methyltransferase 9B isoform 1-T5 [Menidia menidia]
MEEAASQLEREHVHSVYQKIAPYFNDSRYRAWPKVQQFLLDLPPGSIVADIGCGNGKYLHINEDVFKLGCDVCRPLVDFAWSQGHEVQMCDGLALPYRDGCFDAVLSIAVIHHLSTKERRVRAIREMARTLRAGGLLMIYVWAMEQKRRKFEKQDVFIPWNPNPQLAPGFGRGNARPRRRATAQSESEAVDHSEKHRKVRSTSSVADEEDLGGGGAPQPKPHRLWLFSRSLDSVFDFGSLAISWPSPRDLSTLSSDAGESEANKANKANKSGRRGRGRGLIKQVSSFFSPPSAIGSEEDVFDSVTNLHKVQSGCGGGGSPQSSGPDSRGAAVALAPECGAVALPDLISLQREPPKAPGEESQGRPAGEAQRESTQSRQGSEGQVEGPCLRYYHVFREGELAELIENHVGDLHVTHTYFDHANWCVVAQKV